MITNKDKYTGEALKLLNELEKAVASKDPLASIKIQVILNRLLAEHNLTIIGGNNESTKGTKNQDHEQRNFNDHGSRSGYGSSTEFTL
jgi:hypothetical protein